MNLFWLKEESILKQIDNEYNYGLEHIEKKREIRREDIKLYVRESQEDRVDIHSIFTTIQTLLAINYMNEIAVKFTKRKDWDEERASNANIIAQYDYNEMNLEVLDYVKEMHRLMYWVWIQTNDDFDFTSICPSIKNVNPLAYIFDPKWWPTIKDHRFFWIETEMTKEEMQDVWFENFDNLWNDANNTVEINELRVNEARWENYISDTIDNQKFPVYIAWTIFKWEKYIAVTGNSNWTLLKFQKLLPVFKEEEDPSKIMFPIAFFYFSYLPWDSMWISPFDLLRSKQSAYSILFNLMLKMAYKNAMWWDRLINTKKITDLSWLAVPTLEWKDIPVNVETNEDINNIISYVQKDTPTNLPQELRVWLQEENILDSWIDRNTQWVLAQWNNTLWEREMAQKNANLRFLLWSKQSMWWEIFRWKYLWYRQYAANLKSIDKKEFALETWYSSDFHAFTKDDFVGSDMLHLRLESKAQIQQEQEKMKMDRIARFPQEIAEAQAKWENRKVLLLQRNRMRDVWEPEQRVMQIYPYSIDELQAMDKFKILKLAIKLKQKSNWDVAKEWLRINSMDEEHNVYIDLFQTLPEWDIKREAINRRYEAIKNKQMYMEQQQAMTQIPPEQWQTQNWATNSAANTSVAMASAQQLWWWKTNVSSLENISQ